jgi:hypothetical protein
MVQAGHGSGPARVFPLSLRGETKAAASGLWPRIEFFQKSAGTGDVIPSDLFNGPGFSLKTALIPPRDHLPLRLLHGIFAHPKPPGQLDPMRDFILLMKSLIRETSHEKLTRRNPAHAVVPPGSDLEITLLSRMEAFIWSEGHRRLTRHLSP